MRWLGAASVIVLCLTGATQAQQRSPRVNYVLHCAGCHNMTGRGAPDAGVPDFVGLVGAFAGIDEGRTYLMHVPGVVGSGLTNAEIAEVANYVIESWAGDSLPENWQPFTEAEVAERRLIDVPDVVAKRREIVAVLDAMGIKTAAHPWP